MSRKTVFSDLCSSHSKVSKETNSRRKQKIAKSTQKNESSNKKDIEDR